MSNKDVYNSAEMEYDLGYKHGREERFNVVYYDIDDLDEAELERTHEQLQAENIDNLIYLPKGSSLKTFNIEQLTQVRDQFVSYINRLIGDKPYENLKG